ncbi:MAG: GntR family transcriptional regulator, partial [Rubrobacteraceae bacterium]|nr:GntR family transcriptional regulator [Rubrobacteraceae bacterium]
MGYSEDAPAYRRVGDALAARIRSGELAPGARVPSERELAAGQGISRMTARAAVDLLARRGLVERKERSGVFVARPKIEQSLDTVAGFSDQLGRRGVVPGAKVLEGRTVEAGELGDAEVISRLGLSEG